MVALAVRMPDHIQTMSGWQSTSLKKGWGIIALGMVNREGIVRGDG
jgi:hypothetical protein